VVLVSYESLLKLEGLYIKMLYHALGIESDYMPEISDGNLKHIKDRPKESKNKRLPRHHPDLKPPGLSTEIVLTLKCACVKS
jgi:hypothetical protein